MRFAILLGVKRTAIVFGSGGQLGIEVCRELERREWETVKFDRHAVDVTDEKAVAPAIESVRPQLVVNAAAYNKVDVAETEPAAAYQANALAVRNLAVACRQTGARLVHYSTDYVFDGTKGAPYVETDAPHPIGAYAVSKLAGELYAFAYLQDALVVRVSGVFGPGGLFTPHGNFPETMLRLAGQGKPLRVVADHFASPTYAPAAAARTIDLVERDASGVFHLGGGQAISWFDYARLIFDAAGVTPSVTPTDEKEYKTAARRPKFSALSNAKLEGLGIAPMPPLSGAIREYMEARKTVKAHRSV